MEPRKTNNLKGNQTDQIQYEEALEIVGGNFGVILNFVSFLRVVRSKEIKEQVS